MRDYRIHSTAENRMVLGGSAFNIKAESLRLGDFSEQEIRDVAGAAHRRRPGRRSRRRRWRLIRTRTAGQPWLVNALCYDACFRHKPGRDRSRPITADAILEAQERLILRRDTHIDDLANKLREERVRRVVEPILTGADQQAWSTEDVAYVCDLGLVAQEADGTPRIANPIYAEVVPRHLNYAVQAGLPQRMAWYVEADGGLDVEGLIAAFQAFFREHSEHWVQRFERYHEAGPQLLLQAHLQRIVNGGGRIEREYALGRGRTDLLIVWPHGGRERRFVVECKLRRGELDRTVAEGIKQTRAYADRCGAEAGHLIVFDRAPDRRWAEKIFRRAPSGDGVAGHGLGHVTPLPSLCAAVRSRESAVPSCCGRDRPRVAVAGSSQSRHSEVGLYELVGRPAGFGQLLVGHVLGEPVDFHLVRDHAFRCFDRPDMSPVRDVHPAVGMHEVVGGLPCYRGTAHRDGSDATGSSGPT